MPKIKYYDSFAQQGIMFRRTVFHVRNPGGADLGEYLVWVH